MRLNIGSGGKKLEGYVNVDAEPMTEPDVVCNIGHDRWPFDDDSVDEVVAEHILEHLTTPELFHCMKEMYRVCRNEATVGLRLPHPRHDIFLSDPTHQRPIMPGTMLMADSTKTMMNSSCPHGDRWLRTLWKSAMARWCVTKAV